jgi:5-formyltetrahydrofolate cyclo-ligase
VAGTNRVPRPAAGMTALVMDLYSAMLRTLTSGRGVCVRGSGSDDHAARSGRDPAASARAQVAAGGVELSAAKESMRAGILSARRAMDAAERAASGRAIRDALLGSPEVQMAGTVAAYLSVGTEPDTRGLVFALWKRGTYVLLPLLRPDADLNWASYEGPDSLAPGPRGLLEPTEPGRGVTAITSADLVIVPALAADRAGNRLGRGGGSFDRALARVGPAILTVALLYDREFRDAVPAGPLDRRVRAAALPGEGIIRLG